MGNPLVEALHTFKAPEGDFVNEESIGELMEICPAVRSIMDGGDEATNNDVNRGFLSAMGIIFDMIAGSGVEECLSSITSASVERVDKLVMGGKFSLIRDGKPLVPAIVDLMKGKPKPFAGGVLLALACVVKRAEEDYGPADTAQPYSVPEEAEEVPEKEEKAPEAAPEKPRSLDWTKRGSSRADGTTKILADLDRAGIPLDSISLRPEKTEEGIKLQVAIQFGTETTFEEIAKINAMVLAVLGKPVSLKSSSGIWVQLSL
jgi:hypothetical protein